MKFEIPKCPECGEHARGTLETIPGVAQVYFDDESGEYEYEGYTEISWDGQTTDTNPDGEVTLVCQRGHEWLTAVKEESSDAT